MCKHTQTSSIAIILLLCTSSLQYHYTVYNVTTLSTMSLHLSTMSLHLSTMSLHLSTMSLCCLQCHYTVYNVTTLSTMSLQLSTMSLQLSTMLLHCLQCCYTLALYCDYMVYIVHCHHHVLLCSCYTNTYCHYIVTTMSPVYTHNHCTAYQFSSVFEVKTGIQHY